MLFGNADLFRKRAGLHRRALVIHKPKGHVFFNGYVLAGGVDFPRIGVEVRDQLGCDFRAGSPRKGLSVRLAVWL